MNKKLLFSIFFVFLFSLSCVNAEFITTTSITKDENTYCQVYHIEKYNDGITKTNEKKWYEYIPIVNLFYSTLDSVSDTPGDKIFLQYECATPDYWNLNEDRNDSGQLISTSQYINCHGIHYEYGSYSNGTINLTSPIDTIEYDCQKTTCNSNGVITSPTRLPYYFNHQDYVDIAYCVDFIDNQTFYGQDINEILTPGYYELPPGQTTYDGYDFTSIDNPIHWYNLEIHYPTRFSTGCGIPELEAKRDIEKTKTIRDYILIAIDGIVSLLNLVYTLWLITYWIIRIAVLLFGMFVLFKAVTYLYNKMKRLLE